MFVFYSYKPVTSNYIGFTNWIDKTVLIFGTTESDRKFHSFGLSVCNSENTSNYIFLFKSVKNSFPKVLISNASDSITNCFVAVFGKNYKLF